MRTVFVILLVTFGYFVPPVSWNGNSRFDLVRAVVEEGRLSIDSFHRNTGDKARVGAHYYTDKAPGVSLLAVPAYAIFYLTLRLTHQELPSETLSAVGERVAVNHSFSRGIYVATLTTASLWSALAGAILFGFVRSRSGSRKIALVVTLAFALGTPVLPYSTMLYGHALAGAQLWLALALLLPWTPDRESPPTARRAALAGLLGGLSVLCEYPAAIPLAMIALHAYRAGGRRGFAMVCLGALPPLVALLGYHAAAFGGPFTTGYKFVENPLFAGQHQGLLGISLPDPGAAFQLLFGRLRGLFYLSPVLLPAAAGLVLLVRDPALRRDLTIAPAMVAYFILLNASYYMWWGGSAYGPRHAIPMLPFLALGLWPVLRTRYRFAIWPLGALSIANALAATAVGAESPARGDQLADHVWSFILENRVAVETGTSNLGLVMHLRGLLSLLPLLAVWALGALVVLQEEPRRS